MSLKPGIARGWFDKYWRDVYPHDRVVVRGKESKPPRYYDNIFKSRPVAGLFEAFVVDSVFASRVEKAKLRVDDNTPARLQVKEFLTNDKLSRLKRNKLS